MGNLRTNILSTFLNDRKLLKIKFPSKKVSKYYGKNAFTFETMKTLLSGSKCKEFQETLSKGQDMRPELLDAVATAMKNWAINEGATHYTHWFQPLTDATAEKHDAFLNIKSDGTAIEEFKGDILIRQEPDASSFPSGGLRNTFEARGYTVWDPTSKPFLKESKNGKTLYIPTIFVSYTGEYLDNKGPLLKSLNEVNKIATEVCHYFDKYITSVQATLGWEQEFFLVDQLLFNARPDLVLSGRTLFGNKPAKGQQLDDHYFGSISPRVKNYLRDLECEAYKIGIPIKTRHNEVAPAQFEIAPIFEEVNKAVDHNLILMNIMKKISTRHKFKVLFHEKPFDQLNGNGKHNNWSLQTNTDVNLLSPSSKAKTNLQFLTFFINTIKAVHDYAPLLRASIASAGNDHRLGANEAPPAIISVFIGSKLTEVLEQLEKNEDVSIDKGDNLYMKLGIDKIPSILLDNTDRNRTSPFAFTGNKFEFRAVGASANSALPMTILNLIVANQLTDFRDKVDTLIKEGQKKEVAIINVLREYIKSSKNILFEGDGYGDEWVEEAKKRKLENIKDTPRALDTYLKDKNIALFKRFDVLKESEIFARHEVILEKYLMKVQIEADVISELALNTILPVAIKYQNQILNNIQMSKHLGIENLEIMSLAHSISKHINNVYSLVNQMINDSKKIDEIKDIREKAIAYADIIKGKYFDTIRENIDKLELLVDDSQWPLPKYRELLFLR